MSPVTHLSVKWVMSHTWVWHGSLQVDIMTRSPLWHDSLMRARWVIRMYAVTHSHVSLDSCIWFGCHTSHVVDLCVTRHSYMWLVGLVDDPVRCDSLSHLRVTQWDVTRWVTRRLAESSGRWLSESTSRWLNKSTSDSVRYTWLALIYLTHSTRSTGCDSSLIHDS